jgi:hypothetical protein
MNNPSDISIILVFEPRAILAGRIRDWSQFEQIGTCIIPPIVLEELEFLKNRAVEAEEEKIAREFSRFLPDSNWQISNSLVSHPNFRAKDSENLSKSARLQIAILESVYGIAKDNCHSLVVFVSNQSSLRNQIGSLIIMGGIAWYFLQPVSFQQFWQKTGLPSLKK